MRIRLQGRIAALGHAHGLRLTGVLTGVLKGHAMARPASTSSPQAASHLRVVGLQARHPLLDVDAVRTGRQDDACQGNGVRGVQQVAAAQVRVVQQRPVRITGWRMESMVGGRLLGTLRVAGFRRERFCV